MIRWFGRHLFAIGAVSAGAVNGGHGDVVALAWIAFAVVVLIYVLVAACERKEPRA